jgi:hypothetical protein
VILSEPRDRLARLLAPGATVTGVDYVQVAPGTAPLQLRVFFVNDVDPFVSGATPPPGLAAGIRVAGGGAAVPVAPIAPADWSSQPVQGGAPVGVLTLTLLSAPPPGLATYTLTLAAALPGGATNIDRASNAVDFSFGALAVAAGDCATTPQACPPDDGAAPVIDYTAKDFASFVHALGAFSAQAYPNWQERSEADLGVVLMEALAALADEFSYIQDRVAAEATIATATQRRSLTSHARLVDYEPSPVQSAVATLLCVVQASGIPAGVRVSATAPDGGIVPYEIGTGLADTTLYPVSPDWNFPIPAYWWDDGDICLPAGATQLWVQGQSPAFAACKAALDAGGPGVRLLIQTDLPGESRRQIVTLTGVAFAQDTIFRPADGPPTAVTLLSWGAADALTQERNLSLTNVGGNLLPVTQGQRQREAFAIGALPPGAAPTVPLAVARRGPNGGDAEPNWIYRYPLRQSPIAWLAPQAGGGANPLSPSNALSPEITVAPAAPGAPPWRFASNLLQAEPSEAVYTIDPVAWRALPQNGDGSVTYDMDGDGGECLRFGDGTFGARPQPYTMFTVTCRVGAGQAGNVAADTITTIDPNWTSGFLTSVSNPFPASGGADAETPIHVRRMAPRAFQAAQLRAVRAPDYAATAETLPWVTQASAAFRWTGSWLSVFTIADPGAAETISAAQQAQLVSLLNRQRLAGCESFAPIPVYVALDLVIVFSPSAPAIGTAVEAAILAALGDTTQSAASPSPGFLANRFGFGTPLYRSALQAAIQAVPGVQGILAILVRQGGAGAFAALGDVLAPATNSILRIDNDQAAPDRGTIQVIAQPIAPVMAPVTARAAP